MKTFSFYFLSALILFSALAVVRMRNVFRSATALISLLLGIAGLYLLIDAQFLSAVQITVYVGGIVVLIVYVVLLVSNTTQKEAVTHPAWRGVAAGLAALALFGLLTAATLTFKFRPAVPPEAARSATANEIGQALLSPQRNGFALPFEIISLVLVAAIVGAITLAHNPSPGNGTEGKPQ